MVNKYHETLSAPEPQKVWGFTIAEVAVKVAIEFCLAIDEINFLFGEIRSFFNEKGLEPNFAKNLFSPIVAGSFQRQAIPDDLLFKLLKAQEEAKAFDDLEKLVLSINVELYKNKVNSAGQPIRELLMAMCQKHLLIGGALLLLQTSARLKCAQRGCTVVLDMLLNTMET